MVSGQPVNGPGPSEQNLEEADPLPGRAGVSKACNLPKPFLIP